MGSQKGKKANRNILETLIFNEMSNKVKHWQRQTPNLTFKLHLIFFDNVSF